MNMQQSSQARQRRFTASEVAEFEYCPLVWWHEQFEPLAKADTEELFARLVELEHDYGPQATTLPEYDMIEKLLLRAGAFDEGRPQHTDHPADVAEIEEEARVSVPANRRYTRLLTIITAGPVTTLLYVQSAAVFL